MRRYLITVGCSRFPYYDGISRLDFVENDVREIVEFFTSPEQGYIDGPAIPLDSSSHYIKTGVETWFKGGKRFEDDCVVVYIASHGVIDENNKSHYILTNDSKREATATQIKTADLVGTFFTRSGFSPQNILLILDLCNAGQGGSDSTEALSRSDLDYLHGDNAGLWIVATADAKTTAGDGAFVREFKRAIKELTFQAPGTDEFISILRLTENINKSLRHSGQKVRVSNTPGGIVEPFIRNPRFSRPIDPEYWKVKASGADNARDDNWYFAGRIAVFKTLLTWLAEPRPEYQACWITGHPGSGKSAILGFLSACCKWKTADAAARGHFEQLIGQPPPADFACVSVHARGSTLEQLWRVIASELGLQVSGVRSLIAHLERRSSSIGIVLDALDEADEPEKIEKDLLWHLARCSNVRLVFGSRQLGQAPCLDGRCYTIDLDSKTYFDEYDVYLYAFKRLARSSPPSVYSQTYQRKHATAIAKRITLHCKQSFLYARIVSRILADAPEPIDTDQEGWESKVPEKLEEAFAQDLLRFTGNPRAFSILRCLAYARGKGLPTGVVWLSIASKLAEGTEFIEEEITDLVNAAPDLVISDVEQYPDSGQRQVVYRLHHELFAKYIRASNNDCAEKKICDALLSLVSVDPGGQRIWKDISEPYLRHQLSGHAARAGILESLMKDAGFLLTMSVDTLLPELLAVSSHGGQSIARAYRQASRWLRGQDQIAMVSYFQLAALQHNAPELCENLRKIQPESKWLPLWIKYRRLLPIEVVTTTLEFDVEALTADIVSGHTAVFVLGLGGMISVHDVITGFELNRSKAYEGRVSFLEVAYHEGQYLLVAAWRRGPLRVFVLPSLVLLGECCCPHDALTSVCLATVNGRSFVVTAGDDRALRVWSLPSLSLAHERLKATNTTIYKLAATELGPEPVVISGSETHDGRHPNAEPLPVRIWHLPDLDPKGGLNGFRSVPNWLHIARVGAAQLLLVKAGGSNSLVVWDLEQMRQERDDSEYWARFAEIRPRSFNLFFDPFDVLSWGSKSHLIGDSGGFFFHAAVEEKSEALKAVPLRHLIGPQLKGDLWSHPLPLAGRRVLLSAAGDKIRLWNIDELMEDTASTPDLNLKPGVRLTHGALPENNSKAIFVASNSGEVWCLEKETGAISWTSKVCDAVCGISSATIGGVPALIVGDVDGLLHRLNVIDGNPIADPIRIGENLRLSITRTITGTSLCSVAIEPGPSQDSRLRIWDLESGLECVTRPPGLFGESEMDDIFNGSLRFTYREKDINCLADSIIADTPVVFFAGARSAVLMSAVPPHAKALHVQFTGEKDEYVKCVATGRLGGQDLLAAGTASGLISLWNVALDKGPSKRDWPEHHYPWESASATPVNSINKAHKEGVSVIAFSGRSDTYMMMSGGMEGSVKFWSNDFREMLCLDLESPIVNLLALPKQHLAVIMESGIMLLQVF
jgi:WD40 repeat protein